MKSGISTGFSVLSQTSGQVAHVLLIRSRLDLPRCCHRMDLARLACVKHAASVRPEPGSNSPSRSRTSCFEEKQPQPKIGESAYELTELARQLAQKLLTLDKSSVVRFSAIQMRPLARDRPHWLLALCSVFKERWADTRPETSVPGCCGRSGAAGGDHSATSDSWSIFQPTTRQAQEENLPLLVSPGNPPPERRLT